MRLNTLRVVRCVGFAVFALGIAMALPVSGAEPSRARMQNSEKSLKASGQMPRSMKISK